MKCKITESGHIVVDEDGDLDVDLKATNAALKRNKQVDVPTEQWQKSIERRLEALESILFKLAFDTKGAEWLKDATDN